VVVVVMAAAHHPHSGRQGGYQGASLEHSAT
jgi:hypothetical protein